MAEMAYFPFYHSYLDILESSGLSDAEVGRLILALCKYSASGERTPLGGRESIAFTFMSKDIERAKETYDSKCESRRRAVQKRWDKEKAADSIVSDEVQSYTKDTFVYDVLQDDTKATKDKRQKKKTKDNSSNGESIYTPDFEEFWTAYPNKTGKGYAFNCWEKLKPSKTLLSAILVAIESQKNSAQWLDNGGQFIPNPSTWLNQRRWEDTLKPAGSVPVQRQSVKQCSPRTVAEADASRFVTPEYLARIKSLVEDDE